LPLFNSFFIRFLVASSCTGLVIQISHNFGFFG
jgi:hypothetical protein